MFASISAMVQALADLGKSLSEKLKTDKEKQISYDFTCRWNLKKERKTQAILNKNEVIDTEDRAMGKEVKG